MLEQIRKTHTAKPIGPTEKALFEYRFFHLNATLKETAINCHVGYEAAKKAWSRLKNHHDLLKLCPACWQELIIDGVCQSCGREFKTSFKYSEGADSETQAPVYKLMPFGGLGTQTDYNKLGLKYGGRAIQHVVEHGPNSDRKLETLRDKLLQELKGKYNRDDVLDFAERLLMIEYDRLRKLYPDLLNKHGMNNMIINAVSRQLMTYLPKDRGMGAPARVEQNDTNDLYNGGE